MHRQLLISAASEGICACATPEMAKKAIPAPRAVARPTPIRAIIPPRRAPATRRRPQTTTDARFEKGRSRSQRRGVARSRLAGGAFDALIDAVADPPDHFAPEFTRPLQRLVAALPGPFVLDPARRQEAGDESPGQQAGHADQERMALEGAGHPAPHGAHPLAGGAGMIAGPAE